MPIGFGKPVATNIGLSITPQRLEVVAISAKSSQIELYDYAPIPEGTLSDDGDFIHEPATLASTLDAFCKKNKLRGKTVHLSIPATLIRLLELPKMSPPELALSLSSEAESYRHFDNTEASVTFQKLENGTASTKTERIIFGATRQDTLNTYVSALKAAKVKIASIDYEPTHVIRAMAGTGVLDNLVQQIGVDNHWGTLFVESGHIRFSLWQGNQVVEFRDANIQTDALATVDNQSLIIDDIIEEIRRTVKNTVPAIWLTHNLPEVAAQILSERLYTPFRPCMIDPGIREQYPTLGIETLGAALRSVVAFPFDFDLSRNPASVQSISSPSKAGAEASTSTQTPAMSSGSGGTSPWMGAGMACIVLMLLLWGCLAAYNNLVLAGQAKKLQEEQTQLQTRVTALQVQAAQLKRWATLAEAAQKILKDAKIRNEVYVALAEDLIEKTPEQVWVHTSEVGKTIKLEGKALSHKAVIDFARTFDTSPYASSMLIEKIEEAAIGETRVFDYVINGNVFLNPELLPPPPAPTTAAPPAPEAKNSKKQEATQ